VRFDIEYLRNSNKLCAIKKEARPSKKKKKKGRPRDKSEIQMTRGKFK